MKAYMGEEDDGEREEEVGKEERWEEVVSHSQGPRGSMLQFNTGSNVYT